MGKTLIGLMLVAALTIGGCNAISDPVDTELTFTWTAVADDGLIGGPCQDYELRYAASPTDLSDDWGGCLLVMESLEWTPLGPGEAESKTVTLPLEPQVTYYFAIRVADDVGLWSPVSNIVAVEIEDVIPPAAIVDFNGSL